MMARKRKKPMSRRWRIPSPRTEILARRKLRRLRPKDGELAGILTFLTFRRRLPVSPWARQEFGTTQRDKGSYVFFDRSMYVDNVMR